MSTVKDKIQVFAEFKNKPEVPIEFSVHTFADGTKKVQIPESEFLLSKFKTYFGIRCYAESVDDIFVCIMLKDVLRRKYGVAGGSVNLYIESPIYSRYDRVMHEDGTDCCGFNLVLDMLWHNFASCSFKDLHNEDTIKEYDSFYSSSQRILAEQTIGKSLDDFNLIAPDAGACKKLTGYIGVGKKIRNPETGKIESIDVDLHVSAKLLNESSKEILIVDDICEQGGTFFGVVEALRKQGVTKPINLYVTHGIFSGYCIDAKDWTVFNKVYVHNAPSRVHYDVSCQNTEKGSRFVFQNVYSKFLTSYSE